MKRRVLALLSCAFLLTVFAACGGDDFAELDAGEALPDTGPVDGPRDAANADATECSDADGDGHSAADCGGDDCDDGNPTRYPGATEVCDLDDEDCNDTTYGVDADADGFESSACCNGPGNCGSDCNDALNTVNPGAAENCNSLDDDCDGTVDEAVCVDECALTMPCGAGTCTDTSAGYTCACHVGYDGPVGGPCVDIDECARGLDDCGPTASCINTLSTYACACAAGYAGTGHGAGGCTDVNECVTVATCAQSAGNGCTNTIGGYTCACTAGFVASDPGVPATCVNIDECNGGRPGGGGLDWTRCGRDISGVNTCTDTIGGYTCSCGAGFAATGAGLTASCAEVDECARGLDDCSAFASCANSVGSFSCTCAAGFVGTGHGAAGCGWSDPSLLGLTVGAGATLSPAFASATTTYVLTVPVDAASTTLTPTVAQPTHATITVGGITVASGASTAVSPLAGFAPRVLSVVVRTDSGATQTYTVVVGRGSTYVKASNTGGGDTFMPWTGDRFGYALSLSSDGSRLAVGAPEEDSNATGIGGNQTNNTAADSGAVYVFARIGSAWAQEAYIKASNAEAGDLFGRALSLSADGMWLVVGAPREDSSATGVGGNQADNSATNSGAVYRFARTGTTWAQELYFKAPNAEANDLYGTSVAISADGTRFIVGAPEEDSNGMGASNNSAWNSGMAYAVSWDGAVWFQKFLKASNVGGGIFPGGPGTGGDAFGTSVAISADGTRYAVGAPQEDSNATGVGGNQADDTGTYSGAVYVFLKVAAAPWVQEAYIKASNTGISDAFGTSVSLSADGTRLVVGAPFEDSRATGIGGDQADNTVDNAGAVYAFSRTGTTWAQDAYIKASHVRFGDNFGASVSLSADGTRLAVGAPSEDSSATGIGGDQSDPWMSDSGAASVFAWAGSTWVQEAYVKASNTGRYDSFGTSVSLSADGARLAVGAIGEASIAIGINGNQSDDSAPNAGAAYVF